MTGCASLSAFAAGPVYGLGYGSGARLFGWADEIAFRRICYGLIASAAVLGLPGQAGQPPDLVRRDQLADPVGFVPELRDNDPATSSEPTVSANDNQPQRPAPSNPRANAVALIVVALIAAALFWVVAAIHRHNDVQDCLDSGRHDCVDLDQQGR